jgi:hypothetical protein
MHRISLSALNSRLIRDFIYTLDHGGLLELLGDLREGFDLLMSPLLIPLFAGDHRLVPEAGELFGLE